MELVTNMNNIKLRNKEKALQFVLKLPGNGCNLDCNYCFEQQKDVKKGFLSIKQLDNLFCKTTSHIVVIFHGGEPLIVGIERFAQILELVRWYKDRVDGVFLQTNGTLLNNEWINLIFMEYADLHIEIALSLDGSRSMNHLRVDKEGGDTFSRVIEAYNLLNEHHVAAGMLSVVSRHSLNRYDEYVRQLKEIDNLKFVKLNALFNVENNCLTLDSISPIEYAEYVIHVSELYIQERLYKKFPLEPFLSILQNVRGKTARYCNYIDDKCLNFISVYPGGKLGPCDCLPLDDFSIDFSTNDTSLEESMDKAGGSEGFEILHKLCRSCDACAIQNFCHAGCLAQRYYFRNNSRLLDDFCRAKFLLYEFGKAFV